MTAAIGSLEYDVARICDLQDETIDTVVRCMTLTCLVVVLGILVTITIYMLHGPMWAVAISIPYMIGFIAEAIWTRRIIGLLRENALIMRATMIGDLGRIAHSDR